MADWEFRIGDRTHVVLPGSDDDAARLAAKAHELREIVAAVNRCADELAALIREVDAKGEGTPEWIAQEAGLTRTQVQAALDRRSMFTS